jgi:flagellar motor switch protein FliM
MLQVAAPNENVVMIVFEMKIGESRGMLNLCVPASIIEATGTHFVQAWHRQRREPTPTERTWVRENLLRVPLDVSAQLAARLPARDLLMLSPGDILSLGVPLHKPVELRVEDTLKFKGRLASVEGRAGVRVEMRCDPTGTIEV